jgi:hypothetical protein
VLVAQVSAVYIGFPAVDRFTQMGKQDGDVGRSVICELLVGFGDVSASSAGVVGWLCLVMLIRRGRGLPLGGSNIGLEELAGSSFFLGKLAFSHRILIFEFVVWFLVLT